MSKSPDLKVKISSNEESTNLNTTDADYELTKRNFKTSFIIFSKACITFPFYVVALYEPFYIEEYSWILYMEAFHHFHARIFFLLAIYRSLLQIYFSCFSNGYYQKKFVYLEIWFDISLIGLYLHENFSLHNIRVFYSKFFLFYIINTILTVLSILFSQSIKIDHIV